MGAAKVSVVPRGRSARLCLPFSHPARRRTPYGSALGKALGYVQDALVFAAAKPQVQIALCQNEFSVHQNVQRGQQLLLGRR